MRRMRLISEAYEELKAADPNTAVTKTAFRGLVLDGRIPSIPIGNKYLVSMEDVENFFIHGDAAETPAPPDRGKIRKVV